MPRRVILNGAPGVPLVCWILAPAIWPSRACWTLVVTLGAKSLAETVATSMGTFFLLVATPTPVTTTSDRAWLLGMREIFMPSLASAS